MPPSAAATVDDDEDRAPPSSSQLVTEISDSDMDIDNDDGEEEDLEEEVGCGDNDADEEAIEEEELEEEKVNQRRNDNRQHKESVRQLESLSTHEISEAREDNVSNFKCPDPSDGPLMMQKRNSYANNADSWSSKLGKDLVLSQKKGTLEYTVNRIDAEAFTIKTNPEGCSEAYANSRSYLSTSECVTVGATEPLVTTGIEVDFVLSRRNCVSGKANVVLDSKEELKPVDLKLEEAKEHTNSRSMASRVRARSSSPSVEIRDGNKRPAVICDFFAKGWCVRGNSCRFLHITYKADDSNEQPGVDEVATQEIQFDEGVRNSFETMKFPHYLDPISSSTGNQATVSSHISSERFPPREHKENQTLHELDDKDRYSHLQREGISPNAKQFSSSKDDPGFSSSFKHVGIENFRQHWPATDYSNYTSLINRGSSYSFRSSFGSHKLLDGDLASRSSSFLHSASAFSGSKAENFSLAGVFEDRLHHAEYKAKISSDDWEPSVPFRPSFFITPEMISSPISQYEPLRESFDLPNIGDKSFKFSFFSHGASISNTSQKPMYGDSLSNRTFGAESNGDKSTTSFCDKIHGSSLDKNCSTPEKDPFTATTATGGVGIADGENGSAPKEESASGTGYDKVNRIANKSDAGENGSAPKEESASGTGYDKVNRITNKSDACDARPQIDRPRHKKDLKADSVSQNNEMEVDQKIDEGMQKESKVLRHFRSALIDFVKELLKPTWREGHLSKDAHNTIVKKTVEKVLSTLQPHQIPATVESIKQYFSSCQQKMAKLVEGYISKYGKL